MTENPSALWDKSLLLIKEKVTEQQFNTWFKPIVFESFKKETNTLLLQVPSPYVYEYLEQNFLDLLAKVLPCTFGNNISLSYRVVTDKTNNLAQILSSDPPAGINEKQPRRTYENQPSTPFDATRQQQIPSQLNPHLTFNNYFEGASNKLPRSIGQSIAEHPNTSQFNPMFVFGPSGCGKTHLINAIGVLTKQTYPDKRVLYISARLFQVQFTSAVSNNAVNAFINFYQTIDMLIVDDIQEWTSAVKTQETFFHIFNHLFMNGKRIILASDRPPVDLKGMSDRLLTRFSCGLIAELEKPNVELCAEILQNKIKRDGLRIPNDVVMYIAQTASGSVRYLEGMISSLMAYSIVYNSHIDMRLAERVLKRAVKIDDNPLTIDDILDTVCKHFSVSPAAVNGRSRKREYVEARQISMYLAQKYTKMPASRIGKLLGGRDHSTVIHSCSKIEKRISVDKSFQDELASIENSFRLKN